MQLRLLRLGPFWDTSLTNAVRLYSEPTEAHVRAAEAETVASQRAYEAACQEQAAVMLAHEERRQATAALRGKGRG